MPAPGSSKTAIVFGGAGFIGTRLLSELVKSGQYGRLVSADLNDVARKVEGVEYVRADVRQPIAIPGEFPDAEVYNLAAVHTTPGHEDWEYFWTNVLGALRICAFADAIGAHRMIFLSSISVYGPTEAPLDEDGTLSPESAYGRSKYQAEEIHRAWRRVAAGRQLVIVRPAVIFGPGERGNFTRMAALLKGGRFVYPGRTDTVKSCAYVGELVRSIGFVRDLGREETTYNLAYPARYTTRDICAAFAAVAGYRMPRLIVPMWLMLLGGLAFEVLAAIGMKTSVNRGRVMKLFRSTNIVPSVLTQLGYSFETDLEEGLRRWKTESPSGEFV